MSDHLAALEQYRGLREAIETSIIPMATSVDGRRFEYQASLHELGLEAGGYVVIEAHGETRLGQVLSLHMEQQEASALDRQGTVLIRAARGDGAVLDGDDRPFHDARVRPATGDEVSAWLERTRPERARLDVGDLALARSVPFALDAGGFGRHTFLCGQSGSGKTYSLGVLLEQLLMQTSLRVVVLDPNSDYVRLGQASAQASDESVERYRAASEEVAVRSGTSGESRIGVRLRDLSPAYQAALLRLDPVADRSEYAELLALIEDENVRSLEDLAQSSADALKLRAHNLGVDSWGIWPGADEASLPEELESAAAARCMVVDLGSLPTREEQAVAAGAVLERLWRRRARREPVAIVIDEAHNICPAEPAGQLTALTTEEVIRIAGEGRKFGLCLIGVTFAGVERRSGGKMRRLMILVALTAALALSLAVVSQSSAKQGGLSPGQLNDHGWTCFNVPGLGVHCAPPGQEFPPTQPHVQLLYFFNTTDVTSDVPDFTGTESLIRDDFFHGQPCPTEPSGVYGFLGDLGGGAEYWGCHRR